MIMQPRYSDIHSDVEIDVVMYRTVVCPLKSAVAALVGVDRWQVGSSAMECKLIFRILASFVKHMFLRVCLSISSLDRDLSEKDLI